MLHCTALPRKQEEPQYLCLHTYVMAPSFSALADYPSHWHWHWHWRWHWHWHWHRACAPFLFAKTLRLSVSQLSPRPSRNQLCSGSVWLETDRNTGLSEKELGLSSRVNCIRSLPGPWRINQRNATAAASSENKTRALTAACIP
jgi:hypothetical protein